MAKQNIQSTKAILDKLHQLHITDEKIVVLENKYIIEPFIEKVITPEITNWNYYYEEAEKDAQLQYTNFLKPLFNKYLNKDSIVMDFGCGRGRIVAYVKNNVREIACCDI